MKQFKDLNTELIGLSVDQVFSHIKWNELINNRVIIPPAGTEKLAGERRGKEDCYDWWFCHKELK